MNFSQQCRECSVQVENGTGVFYQPQTEEYSYILTAKHNLYVNYETEKCSNPIPLKEIKIISYNKNIEFYILGRYEIDTCEHDIAILKIKKVDIFSQKIILDDRKTNEIYWFYGYPSKRENNKKYSREEQVRNFKLEFFDTFSTGEIIVKNDEYYTQEDINGCSGGGVFKDIDNIAYLVGIEFRMDYADKTKESNNTRLRFFDIKAFDEIVKGYSDELVYLDEEKRSNQKYNVHEDVIELDNGKTITIKTVPVKVDGKILNVSIYPVTFEEYDLFCEENKNFSKINHTCYDAEKSEYPIVNVSWDKAEAYCLWLGTKMKKECRLLESSEWNKIVQFLDIDDVETISHSCDELQKNNITKKDVLGLNNFIGNICEWCWDGNETKKYIKGIAFSDKLKDMSYLRRNNMVRKSTPKPYIGFRIVF